LLDGEEHDRYSAAAKFGVNHAAAYDLLKLISRYRPEIQRIPGRPVKFRRQVVVDEGPVSVVPALAANFAAGFARSFHGTLIEKELVQIRERTMSRLSQSNLRQFEHIDRKVVVLTPEETDVRTREKTLLNLIDAVLRQIEVNVEYQPFDR